MATQQDLQDLLRLLTVSRKTPMIQAMGQIKALQAVNLKSIKDIADADLSAVQSAIKDEKQARSLHSACKAMLKRGSTGGKRDAPPSASEGPSPKRPKPSPSSSGPLPGNPTDQPSPQELEASLALPVSTDETAMARTVLQTNRAPLVLAFATELLRHTMPEQPPSSRLSLAQAVVSANSRSKAVSLGLEKAAAEDPAGWAAGQPKVRVLGRDVPVLKRGGYEWKGEEEVGGDDDDDAAAAAAPPASPPPPPAEKPIHPFFQPPSHATSSSSSASTTAYQQAWSTSPPTSLKASTFVARATTLPASSPPPPPSHLLAALFASVPRLRTATHNAWAWRSTAAAGRVAEHSGDDGETGAGALLLRVMRELGAADAMVVMSRWYGGVMLGPDRWRLMRNVVVAALGERLRRTGEEGTAVVGGEAVWGLDLEEGRTAGGGGGGWGRETGMGQGTGVVGMRIHSPQAARAYLMRSFASAPDETEAGGNGEEALPEKRKKAARRTVRELDAEKEENLGLLLGALRLLFDSWADYLTPAELDRRAWSWYVAVRPEVDVGPSGWGAKGLLRLEDILKLRRKENA